MDAHRHISEGSDASVGEMRTSKTHDFETSVIRKKEMDEPDDRGKIKERTCTPSKLFLA